jgi:hypothetical protein
MRPAARRDGLLIRELPGELLVYDLEHHRAHCLNRTAATVFRHADGTRTAADLALVVAPEAAPEAGVSLVGLALGQLGEAGLLEDVCAEDVFAPPGLSRRELVRRAGIAAALLLPAVASVVAPTPAEAAATCATSCVNKADGTPCTCFSADPCTATCVSDSCSDGGGC